MHEKQHRQAALLRLVRRQAVANQKQLVRALRRLGFAATQASVSRDLRDLGLVKVDGVYRALPRLGSGRAAPPAAAPLSRLITAVEPVGVTLIVVRTRVGAASTVAVALDRQPCPDIVGTIAGHDTIFVAVRSRSAQGRAEALLRRLAAAG